MIFSISLYYVLISISTNLFQLFLGLGILSLVNSKLRYAWCWKMFLSVCGQSSPISCGLILRFSGALHLWWSLACRYPGCVYSSMFSWFYTFLKKRNLVLKKVSRQDAKWQAKAFLSAKQSQCTKEKVTLSWCNILELEGYLLGFTSRGHLCPPTDPPQPETMVWRR